MAMKKQIISKIDSFTHAYITSLLWQTNEDDFPEYCYSGEFSISDSDIERFTKESLELIITDCAKFQEQFAELLEQAGDDSQNGHDFALTRQGAGVGFTDRGYGELGEQLRLAAKNWSEVYFDKIGNRIYAR